MREDPTRREELERIANVHAEHRWKNPSTVPRSICLECSGDDSAAWPCDAAFAARLGLELLDEQRDEYGLRGSAGGVMTMHSARSEGVIRMLAEQSRSMGVEDTPVRRRVTEWEELDA